MSVRGHRIASIAAFHTQQAAEKLLKALIAASEVMPPRVHDLTQLAEAAVLAEPGVRDLVEQIEGITSWAVLTRYPAAGDTPLPTLDEIVSMLALVRRLREFVADTTT